MATKKTAPKRRRVQAAKSRHQGQSPSPALVDDLREVFIRHGWQGLPDRLAFGDTSEGDRTCEDGSKAQGMWITCSNGDQKYVYTCPGENPTC